MTVHKIDFDEVQKAMEDIAREAFDYFLDTETGQVVILSEDILEKARSILADSYEEDLAEFEAVELDEECNLPEWAEDEVELALDVFVHQQERFRRIPERRPEHVYEAMQGFAASLEDRDLGLALREILEGKGAFRRFKDALQAHPKEKKQWYGYNAMMARKEISAWLGSIGLTAPAEDQIQDNAE
ncbi:MAG: UPF0158 family protein [Nitrospiraceae bacterium]|nr:UPF0158 family protein [Nitrospiraceae bacterium]